MDKANIDKRNGGFTMVEVLVYVSIIVVVITVFNGFARDVIRGSARTAAVKEVHQNARLTLSRITHEIKRATTINDLQLSSIELVSGSDIATIYLNDTEKAVYLDNGTKSIPLTNSEVRVTKLEFIGQEDGIIRINIKVEEKSQTGHLSNQYFLETGTYVTPRNSLY